MDDRKIQLKELKKEYKREKRRTVTPWKTVAIISLVLCLLYALASCIMGALYSTGSLFPAGIEKQGWAKAVYEFIKPVEAVGTDLILSESKALIFAPVLTGVYLVLFAGTTVLWARGKKKWISSEPYLNYKTMKNVLAQEKAVK